MRVTLSIYVKASAFKADGRISNCSNILDLSVAARSAVVTAKLFFAYFAPRFGDFRTQRLRANGFFRAAESAGSNLPVNDEIVATRAALIAAREFGLAVCANKLSLSVNDLPARAIIIRIAASF
jgi:hypothetical protein